MPIDQGQIDPVEQALQELEQAERSGLFQRTQVSTDASPMANPEFFLNNPSIRRWMMAAAAVIVFAFGVWGVMFRTQLGALREQSRLIAANTPAPRLQSLIRFAACMEGPAGGTSAMCREQDRNTDDRVDLRDFSTFLLASASDTR